MMRIAESALSVKKPGSAGTAISALRQVGLMAGYYRQEEVATVPADAGIGGSEMERLRGMSDQELIRMLDAGA